MKFVALPFPSLPFTALLQAGAQCLTLYHTSATEDVFTQYEVTQTPTAVVFDASGRVVSRDVYTAAELPRLAALLNTLQQDETAAGWGV